MGKYKVVFRRGWFYFPIKLKCQYAIKKKLTKSFFPISVSETDRGINYIFWFSFLCLSGLQTMTICPERPSVPYI